MGRKSDADLVAEFACNYIDRKGDEGGRGSNRDAYAGTMSASRWQNRAFDGLVNTILDALDDLEDEFKERNDNFEDWLKPAVEFCVDGHFAMAVLADRRASDELTDRIYNDMQDTKDRFLRIVGGDQRGGRGGRRDGGGARVTSGLGQVAMTGDSDSGRGQRDTGSRRVSSMMMSPEERAEVASVPREEPRQEERVVREEPARRAPVVEQRTTRKNGPDFTQPRPHEDYWLGDEHWQLARISTWVKNYDPYLNDGEPVIKAPTLVDLKSQILYFVKDSQGRVREEIVDVDEDTRYMQHAALDDPKRNAGIVAIDTSPRTSVVRLGRNNSNPSQEAEQEVRKVSLSITDHLANTNKEGGDFAQVDSLTIANFSARYACSQQGQPVLKRFLMRTPCLVSGPEQEKLLNELETASNLAEICKLFNENANKFDANLWSLLNQRFSTQLLRATRYQWQLEKLKNINFATSFQTFMDKLSSSGMMDESTLAGYSRRIRFIASKALARLSGSDVIDTVADLLQSGNEVPAMVFVDYLHVVAVPGDLDSMGIGSQLRTAPIGLALTSTVNAELFRAVSGMYNTITAETDNNVGTRLFISTSDNHLIEVLPFMGRTDAFVLTLEQ